MIDYIIGGLTVIFLCLFVAYAVPVLPGPLWMRLVVSGLLSAAMMITAALIAEWLGIR